MNIGGLRHRITIEQCAQATDSFGAPVKTWATFANVWAAVEPIKGREYFSAQQVNAEVTHRVRIRHLRGLTPTMRVNWDGRVFNIESVLNIDERNQEMHLMCVEVLAS